MTKAEFWARLTGIYPDELRHVLNGARLGDVFPVREEWEDDKDSLHVDGDSYYCELCMTRHYGREDGLVHGPHCPGGFR